MNILNVFYSFKQGGVERLGISVANHIALDTENTSCVCVLSHDYSQELLNLFNNKVKLYVMSRKSVCRKLGYVIRLIKIIKENHIEIIHFHQGNLMLFFCMIKCLCPSVKFFYTVHDTYIFSELSKMNRFLGSILCKKIIAISNGVLNDILKCGIKTNQTVRIYNGVNFASFPIVSRPKIKNSYTIINVARFVPSKKGQELLIKATAILYNKGYPVHTILVGGEPEGISGEIDRMKDLARKLKIEHLVRFTGNVNNVYELLKCSDLFCIPSYYEGFGISAVEAMGSGLPCVASDIEGLNEVVNSERLGFLFQPGNEIDLAKKIELVINNIDKYNAYEIGNNVRERFSIENMCNQLLDIYRM